MRDKDLLDKEVRKEILDAVERVVDYAHANKIDTVLLAGRKAGHFHDLFRIIWGRKYKTRPPYFVSPGHISTPNPEGRVALIKEKLSQGPILKKLKGNILLFDDFAWSGGTLLSYDRALKELGIQHRIATVFVGHADGITVKLSSQPFIGKQLKSGKLGMELELFGRSQTAIRQVRQKPEQFSAYGRHLELIGHKYNLAMFKRLKKLAHKKPR